MRKEKGHMGGKGDSSAVETPTFHGEDGSGHSADSRKGKSIETTTKDYRTEPKEVRPHIKQIGG